VAFFLLGYAENRGGMDGRDQVLCVLVTEWLSSFFGQAKLTSEERLSRRRTQADDHLGLDQPEFRLEPWFARVHFTSRRPFVNSPFPALFEAEMFHGVGDVNGSPVDSRFFQGGIQDAPGGPYERMPLLVLFVTGLLTNENDASGRGSLAEYHLSRRLVEIAPFAFLRGVVKGGQAEMGRNEACCPYECRSFRHRVS
jgi:hypothetical protein